MKKYILSLFAVVIFAAVSFAQSTTPKFGITPNSDNTGRVLNYTKILLTDTTGADSAILTPKHYTAYVDITLKDSFTLKQPVVTYSSYGDHLIIIAHAPSGTPKLKFSGTNWQTAGTATLSTGLRAIIQLYFDGAIWVEASRVVQ